MGFGRSSSSAHTRVGVLLAVAMLVSCLAVVTTTRPAAAASLPPGFQEEIVFSGLTQPTAVRFSPDGRVFVAEKSGIIKVFDNLTDTTPTVFADLRTQVHNFWDRGLLGLALAPNFPTNPWVYVLYTFDAAIGGTAPRWGSVGGTSDGCPTPPGATADGCVVAGRLSRLQASGNVMIGSEQVLIEDWCQQYPSHSIGSLAFGADGALYVSGGDGASFNFVDYGQDGAPVNPCGDPPGGVGGVLTPPDGRGWGPAQPGPPDDGRPHQSRRRDPAGRSGHGRRPPRQPDGVQHRPQRSPHRGPRAAQPVPHHDPSRHQRGLDR